MVGAYRIKPNIFPPHNLELDLTFFNPDGGTKVTIDYSVKDSENQIVWKDTLTVSPPEGSYTTPISFPIDKEGSYVVEGTAKTIKDTASFGQTVNVNWIDLYWPPLAIVGGVFAMHTIRNRRKNHQHYY